MRKIVLLGYMGSGKTTVGKLLADSLNLPFRDLDELIEAETNLTIPEIFVSKGELFFRKKEMELLEDTLKAPREFVLSSGGGTPCYGNNMDLIQNHASDVVYLRYTVPELVNRLLKERENRPLLSHINEKDLPEYIGKHLLERAPFYQRATIILDVKDRSPNELAECIKKELV